MPVELEPHQTAVVVDALERMAKLHERDADKWNAGNVRDADMRRMRLLRTADELRDVAWKLRWQG